MTAPTLLETDHLPRPLPHYRCHKEVWAAQITRVEQHPLGTAVLHLEGFAPLLIEHDLVRRYMPIAGDYLVIYEPDGYRSISPKGAFEDGYARIE